MAKAISPVAEVMPRKSPLGKALALLGIAGSIAFLLNLGAGVWFEIPDNLPIIGNVDEAGATALLLYCLRYLGLDLLRLRR